MSEELIHYLMVQIKNMIVLICFTILAIVFQNFWLVFGSILFWTIQSKDEKGG